MVEIRYTTIILCFNFVFFDVIVVVSKKLVNVNWFMDF
jgi:hypothetical protein